MPDVSNYAKDVVGNPDDQSVWGKVGSSLWDPIADSLKSAGKYINNPLSTPLPAGSQAEDFNPPKPLDPKDEIEKPLGPDQGFYGQIGQLQIPRDERIANTAKALAETPEYIPNTKYLAQSLADSQALAGQAGKPAEAYQKAIAPDEALYKSRIEGTRDELAQAKAKGEEAFNVKEAAVKQVLAEHPLLTSEEVRNSYSFGEKLLLGIAGGLGHNPNLFNDIVQRKVNDSKESYQNALQKLTASADTSLEHVNYTYDKAISLSNVDSRVLGAAKEAAQLKQQSAQNVTDKLQAQKAAADAGWAYEQSMKYVQDLKNARKSLTDSAYATAAMDPNFVQLGIQDAQGQQIGAYPKPGYEKEVMEAAPKFQAVYGENGSATKLLNYLERTGNKDMRDKAATNLFNQVIQESPFKLDAGDYQKMGIDPTANYTNGEMIYYLKQIQNNNILKFKNMTRQPQVDPRLIRSELLKAKRR